MSTDDDIFLTGAGSLEDVAQWLGEALELEPVDEPRLKNGVYLFRGRARTAEGQLYFLVEPNVYGEKDAEPEDVSAIDRYIGVVDVRLTGLRDEVSQSREARAAFDVLAATQPDIALVLSHAMSWIVAAYLPGAGTHSFPPETSLDGEDIEAWRPWVVWPAGTRRGVS